MKKLNKKQMNLKEMTTGSVGVGAKNSNLVGNTDSYAPGDARIPKVLGGVVRRPGMGPKTKKKSKSNLFESKFIEHIKYEQVIPENMICYTIISNPNLMRITEDIIQKVAGEYTKTTLDNGDLAFEFPVTEGVMNDLYNRINGLFGDRLGKTVWIYLGEKVDPKELDLGEKDELEHKDAIKEIDKPGKISLKRATGMIAKDHLRKDPKYYSKLIRREKREKNG